jgi:hypothetical protein
MRKLRILKETHNRNFSFHLGHSVLGRTDVALMYLAGTALEKDQHGPLPPTDGDDIC